VQVGLIRELPVYAPNSDRLVRIALKMPPGVSLGGGTLTVTFAEPGANRRRAQASAEATLPG
jgi:hypothetical protein